MSNYTQSVIPLEWFIKNYDAIVPRLLGETKDDTIPALMATGELCRQIYYRREFETVRNRIRIGLIKETPRHGNTSVSMGAAMRAPHWVQTMCYLNCGSGGIKYQLYSREGGHLHLVDEYKPKDGANPGAILVGQYKPKKPLSIEDSATKLIDEFKDAQKKLSIGNVPTVAFVTGDIRAHWEDAPESEKKEMNQAMRTYFSAIGALPLNGEYFITQAVEGELELAGTTTMYSNLVNAGLLGSAMVGVSFGIGRRSTQFTIRTEKGTGLVVDGGANAGMNDPAALEMMPYHVIHNLTRGEALRAFISNFSQPGDVIIALKSGTTLHIEKNGEVKDRLIAPIPEKKAVALVRAEARIAELELTIAGLKAMNQKALNALTQTPSDEDVAREKDRMSKCAGSHYLVV